MDVKENDCLLFDSKLNKAFLVERFKFNDCGLELAKDNEISITCSSNYVKAFVQNNDSVSRLELKCTSSQNPLIEKGTSLFDIFQKKQKECQLAGRSFSHEFNEKS